MQIKTAGESTQFAGYRSATKCGRISNRISNQPKDEDWLRDLYEKSPSRWTDDVRWMRFNRQKFFQSENIFSSL